MALTTNSRPVGGSLCWGRSGGEDICRLVYHMITLHSYSSGGGVELIRNEMELLWPPH